MGEIYLQCGHLGTPNLFHIYLKEYYSVRIGEALVVAPWAIDEIWNTKHAVSAKMVPLLAGYFDTAPEFWMNLEIAWDL